MSLFDVKICPLSGPDGDRVPYRNTLVPFTREKRSDYIGTRFHVPNRSFHV